MVKSGCQMCMSWTQVTSLLKPGDVIIFIYHFFSFFFFFGDTTDVKFVLYAICFFKQYRWSGCSSQLLDQCHHLDVAIQLQWSKSDCLSMVAEVKLHHYPHIPSTVSAFCILCNVFLWGLLLIPE